MVTKILTNSDKDELNLFIRVLTSCSKHPGMYGLPEYAELSCKHITHIYLSIVFHEWNFEATEKFWRGIAITFGGEENFTPIVYEQITHREEKWGDAEDAAKRLILKSFEEIWQYLKQNCQIFPYTSEWIEFLFKNHSLLGSPDSLDVVFRFLIGISLIDDHCYKLYKEMYEEICIEIKGSGSLGLLDVGVREDWSYKVDRYNDLASLYDNLGEGLLEVIKQLKAFQG